MIELLIGCLITLTSLLVGFSLGRHQSVMSPDLKKQLNQIFRKVVPNPDIGAIERPTQQQNFYRDNPAIAKEHKIMEDEFGNLIKQ